MTGDAKRPEPFLNLLVQDCKTEVYSIPGECSVTCGVGLRPVERVVAIVQPKNLLGKDCTETPGRRPGQPEPCNTNQICPTDPPETTYPPETNNTPDGIGVRIGLDGKTGCSLMTTFSVKGGGQGWKNHAIICEHSL